ncbi:MAG: hypothetical protein JXR94_00295, partial [Candidatus Hydrogenedentes bacterium]|nr:hypothetical protein [Candidatus Hydrogenedentota bacterium]
MDKARGILLAICAAVSAGAGEPVADDLATTPGVAFETYLARWWGAPGSEMTRPIYRMARFDADSFQVHYGIVPGRPLSDYTMPYWPIRSFLSFVDAPAELAQQVQIAYGDAAGSHTTEFIPRSGVEIAPCGNALAVKIGNRSIATPEDVTTAGDAAYQESTPFFLEEVLVIRKGARIIPIECRLSNVGTSDLHGAAVSMVFAQSFGWGRFGVAENGAYAPVAAPAAGEAAACYAFSEGMGRGYAFIAGEGTRLRYELAPEMNRWRVTVTHAAGDVPPSAARRFAFAIEVLDAVPEQAAACPAECDVLGLEYRRIQPASFKAAPVFPADRIQIDDLIADLGRPKVRGLNLRGGFPQALDDLDTLQQWGCNFVITGMGEPDQTAAVIERGHALGMEMLLAGRGSYEHGAPEFDTYYEAPRTPAQVADAHGQDEDHYYWYAIPPSAPFEERFGKPLSAATHDDEVAYWAGCFVDKWRGVHRQLEPVAPEAGVWFYAPFPGVAHVDPLDSYDLFMRTIA